MRKSETALDHSRRLLSKHEKKHRHGTEGRETEHHATYPLHVSGSFVQHSAMQPDTTPNVHKQAFHDKSYTKLVPSKIGQIQIFGRHAVHTTQAANAIKLVQRSVPL